MEWKSMDEAPKDGTTILACRDNGCGWEYDVVWWSTMGGDYPWVTSQGGYPEGRLDYWQPLPAQPYDIEN